MTCFVNEGNIYDSKGNEIQPDNNGIIVFEVDNKPRRFVKNKLIDWLTRNNQLMPPPGKVAKEVIKVKRNRPKKYAIHKIRKVRTDFTRKGISIIAKKDGKEYGPFISLTKCSKEIKVSKSQISKVLLGTGTTTTGFQFIKV